LPQVRERSNSSDGRQSAFVRREPLAALLADLKEAPPTDNVFISPLSAAIALALALEGARGQTASQMSRVLGWDKVDDSQRHSQLMTLVEEVR